VNWSRGEIEEAWSHARQNVREVQASTLCVCIQCQTYFPPSRIVEWLNPAGEHTFRPGPLPTSDKADAFCPNCGMDFVIGDASGLPIQNPAFMRALNSTWNQDASS
jgi:hypothetical protein